jgi:hypothetical protein
MVVQSANRNDFTMNQLPVRTPSILAALLGLVYVTAQLRIPVLASVPPIWQFAISFVVIFPITWFLVSKWRSGFVVLVMFIAGVATGVLVDVALDSGERNLFPIEVIWWWVLLGPACALGAIVATKFRSNKAQT